MIRSLGPAVALSILAHGSVMATVGVLGAIWLAGAPPTLAPALYVDLVEPVLATNDRITPRDDPAPRLRRPGRTARSSDIVAARPRARTDGPVQPDATAPDARESTARASSGPATVMPEIARPPVAPVAPEPRASVPEPPQAAARDTASVPEPLAPSPAPAPPAGAASVLAGSEAMAPSSSPAASVSPRRPLGEEPGALIAPPFGGSVGQGPAALPGGSSTAGTSGSGAYPSEGSGAKGITRFVPGDARSSGAGDGLVPPEYEAYVRALRQRVQDRLVYPGTAVRRGQQGVLELEVRVGAQGDLVGIEVLAGPRVETLRTAAVSAVRGAAPFPFPPGVEGRPLVIRLPVEFKLR